MARLMYTGNRLSSHTISRHLCGLAAVLELALHITPFHTVVFRHADPSGKALEPQDPLLVAGSSYLSLVLWGRGFLLLHEHYSLV